MYKVNVNDQNFYTISDGQVEGRDDNMVLKPIGNDRFHILFNNKSFEATLEAFLPETKQVRLIINQQSLVVTIKDQYDLLLAELGMEGIGKKVIKEIKAPMPGLVLKIEIEKGTEVKKDDALIVLEAMKMENVIKSPTEGVIQSIEFEAGNAIEKNQVLIRFE